MMLDWTNFRDMILFRIIGQTALEFSVNNKQIVTKDNILTFIDFIRDYHNLEMVPDPSKDPEGEKHMWENVFKMLNKGHKVVFFMQKPQDTKKINLPLMAEATLNIPKGFQIDSSKLKYTETVNHPPHYNTGRFEVIDVIEDWEMGFNLGNALKYIARAGKKDPLKELEDLRKAKWYLEREIKNVEKRAGMDQTEAKFTEIKRDK